MPAKLLYHDSRILILVGLIGLVALITLLGLTVLSSSAIVIHFDAGVPLAESSPNAAGSPSMPLACLLPDGDTQGATNALGAPLDCPASDPARK